MKIAYGSLQIALLKSVRESRVALRRVFQEMTVLRKINLRRIVMEFHCSEVDISGNDCSEEDKS